MASREPYHGITAPLSYQGADPAILLAAFYNNANSGGLGLFHYTAQEMSVADARAILRVLEQKRARLYFGYINGRSLKLIMEPERQAIVASKYGSYNGVDTATVIDWARAGISSRVREKFDAEQSLDTFLATTGSTVARGNQVKLGITQALSDALEETVARKSQAAPQEARPQSQSYHVDLPAGAMEKGKRVYNLTIVPRPEFAPRLRQLLRRLRPG